MKQIIIAILLTISTVAIAVKTPPLEKVTMPLNEAIINNTKWTICNFLVLEKTTSKVKKQNIPNPRTVETWLGPNPPDVSKFDWVPVTTSLIEGVYKNK